MPYFRTKSGRRDVVQCVGKVTEDDYIEPVVVLHKGDWLKLVAYIKLEIPICWCEGDCLACRDDKRVAAIIKRVEASNG